MPLQTSGPISLADIAAEFGGSAPHSLSEYYRGGGLVPDTPANAGIPTSGSISLSDFYGGDATVARVDAIGGTYTSNTVTPTNALSQFRLLNSGSAQKSTTNPESFTTVGTWLLSGAAGDYDVRWDASGDTADLTAGSAAINTWLNLATSRLWGLEDTSQVGPQKQVTGPLRIRDASTLAELDTATLTLNAQEGA